MAALLTGATADSTIGVFLPSVLWENKKCEFREVISCFYSIKHYKSFCLLAVPFKVLLRNFGRRART